MPRTATRATTVGLYKKVPRTGHFGELSTQCTDPTDIPWFVVLITNCVLRKNGMHYETKNTSQIAITDGTYSSIQIADLGPKPSKKFQRMEDKDLDNDDRTEIIAESGHKACMDIITSRDSIYYWDIRNTTNSVITAKVIEAVTDYCDNEEEEDED